MKLSTKGRYGLRALLYIAIHSGEEPISIRSIADSEHISEGYLEQLMPKLKKAGMIESMRGAQGGYRLAKPTDQISVGDILRALEGDLEAVSCPGLHTDSREEDGCQGADACVTKYVWQRINESIAKTVDEITLSTLVEENRRIKSNGTDHTDEPRACEKHG